MLTFEQFLQERYPEFQIDEGLRDWAKKTALGLGVGAAIFNQGTQDLLRGTQQPAAITQQATQQDGVTKEEDGTFVFIKTHRNRDFSIRMAKQQLLQHLGNQSLAGIHDETVDNGNGTYTTKVLWSKDLDRVARRDGAQMSNQTILQQHGQNSGGPYSGRVMADRDL